MAAPCGDGRDNRVWRLQLLVACMGVLFLPKHGCAGLDWTHLLLPLALSPRLAKALTARQVHQRQSGHAHRALQQTRVQWNWVLAVQPGNQRHGRCRPAAADPMVQLLA